MMTKATKSISCLKSLLIKGLFFLFFCSVAGSAMAQKKPLVVFVTGDHEYSGEQTLPFIAAELEKTMAFGLKC